MGYDQVQAIEDWLRENIAYLPGTSAVPISAAEVKQRSSGVCRDLSHLGIALCRSLDQGFCRQKLRGNKRTARCGRNLLRDHYFGRGMNREQTRRGC